MVKYYLRTPKQELSSIRLKCSISKRRFEYDLPDLKIPVKYWDLKKQRVKYAPNWRSVERTNILLDKLDRFIHDLVLQYRINIEYLPLSEVRKRVSDFLSVGPEGEELSFLEFFDLWMKERRMSGLLSVDTVKRDKTLLNKIESFNRTRRVPFSWSDIDSAFLKKFESFFIQKGYSTNYISKMIKMLKMIIRDPRSRKYIPDIKFLDDVRLNSAPTESIYLTIPELKRIKDLNLELQPGLDKVRDHFLCAAFSGVRYSDLNKIGDQIETTEEGKKILIVQTQKTRETVSIPLHSVVSEILEKYLFTLPDPISNQKMNSYLKVIAKAAQIDDAVIRHHYSGNKTKSEKVQKWKLVTTHTARRSFATNTFLAGVPVLSIMKITGHRTQSSFMKYIRMSSKESAVNISGHEFFS